jgi:hypothetical protein
MLDLIGTIVLAAVIALNITAFSNAIPGSTSARLAIAAGAGAWAGLAAAAAAAGQLANTGVPFPLVGAFVLFPILAVSGAALHFSAVRTNLLAIPTQKLVGLNIARAALKVLIPPRVQRAISLGAGRYVNSGRIKHDERSFWRRFVEVDIKSEDVFYHGSRVRVSNNNAHGWMVRGQLNNYRRNLSEMAKSMARHIKNNSPRIPLHHVSPILGKNSDHLMMAAFSGP